LQRAAELEPNNATTWTTIGATQYRQSNWNESIAAFKKALELKPSELIYSNIGTSYFFLGRYDEARANFEKAVDMRPQDPYLVGNLADCYRWLGQQEKANSTYDRAIALAFQSLKTNPRDAVALGFLGLFYAKKHDTARGLEFIRRARELNPSDVALFYEEAVINTLASRMPEALQSLREALSRGYSVREAYTDPELKDLRQRPEFPAMAKQFQPKSGS
jgi:tetratricopeptide (TPR) repeat protein